MNENEPGLFQQMLFFLALIGAWVAGEAGRAALAAIIAVAGIAAAGDYSRGV